MKEYVVYFIVKYSGTEYLRDVVVEAPNSKEACRIAKSWYHEKTGRNAFRPTTKRPSYYEDYENRGLLKHLDRMTYEV